MRWSHSYRVARIAATAGVLGLLVACASQPPVPEGVTSDDAARVDNQWAAASSSSANPARWMHQTFPGKRPTLYQYQHKDGRDALMVRAQSSVSMLRKTVRVEPDQLGRLRFSWMVPDLIAAADVGTRDADDSPVRVVLAFDGDRKRFSMADTALSELSEMLTGEPLPYATLMYVWGNRRPPGSVVTSARTSRIRKIVMESGPGRLHTWLDYERDVRADFVRAFGEAPGALLAIGIMTDSDNTRTEARAWYGPIRHVASPDTLRVQAD